jgi:uncharacterized membrane protein
MEPWNVLLASHVIAALFVLATGPVQILRRRRDRIHRTMGHLWVAAMYYVCFSSFWIVSDGHFSWLHGLSAFTIVTVTLGLISAMRRNIPAHRGNMIGSYIGIAVAFGFAVAAPGRAIPRLLGRGPADGPVRCRFGGAQRRRRVRFAAARRGPANPGRGEPGGPARIEGFSKPGCRTGRRASSQSCCESGRVAVW